MSQNDPTENGVNKDIKLTVIPEGQAFILALLAGGVPAQITFGTPAYFFYPELASNWKTQVSQATYARPDGSLMPAFNLEDPFSGEVLLAGESDEPSEEDSSKSLVDITPDDVVIDESGRQEPPVVTDDAQKSSEIADPVIDAPAAPSQDGVESSNDSQNPPKVASDDAGVPAVDSAQQESSNEAPPAPDDVIDEGGASDTPPVDEVVDLTAEQLSALSMPDLREVGQKFEVKDSSKDGLIEKILAAQAALKEAASEEEEESGSDE